MKDRYRVGLIGAGSISKYHMTGYQGMSDKVEVVAIADTHPDARAEFCQKYNVPKAYADYREMVDKEGLDIVSICTWHGLHARMTVETAKRKVKGIICEKPMATSLGEADEMVEAAERNGVKLVIGHQRRFLPAWMLAMRLVGEGAVGVPIMLVGRIRDGLLNWGTHVVDCMRYLLGEPNAQWVIGQVERNTDRYERGLPCEDALIGLISFAGSAQGFLESELTESATAGGLTLYGSHGVLELDENRLRLLEGKGGGWQEFKPAGEDPHVAQLRELIDWIEGRVPEHRGSGRKAWHTAEIMMAIYESARLNSRVTLPLTERRNPLILMIEEGKLPVKKPGRYDIRAFLLRDQEK